MLIEFSAENIFSIKQRVTFSLEAGPSKKHPQNIYRGSSKLRILRSASIYGPNASGKTNLLKVLAFACNLVRESHKFNADVNIARSPFKLDSKWVERPSSIELIFLVDDIRYKYGFSILDDRIVGEHLYYWPSGRRAMLFQRKNVDDYQFRTDISKQNLYMKQMSKNVLYLSRATQLGYDKTRPAFDFFTKQMMFISGFEDTNLFAYLHDNERDKEMVLDVLKRSDFGGIKDINIEKKDGKLFGIEMKVEKNQLYSRRKEEDAEIFETMFIRYDEEGTPIGFRLDEESFGTRKAIILLTHLFRAMNEGKTLIVDELETSFHPTISMFLMRLFNERAGARCQVLFTTHNSNLLDNSLFRRDQIFITEKGKDGATSLSSLLDYEMRESMDFERMYLSGRVGGLPFIDESIFDKEGE